MSKINNKRAALALLAAFGAGNTHAAGFQLFEQGASGLGTAYSAGAAAEDASTIYWNPAGMTYLPGKNLSLGMHLIKPSAKFTNNGSAFAVPPVAGAPVTGGNGDDAGGLNVVPNVFYSHELNDKLRIGVGVGSIFGLKTNYDEGWVGRYQALKSDLRTINLNPSLAYKINDKFSIGGGLDIVRADVELTSAINFGLVGAAAVIPVIAQNPLTTPQQKQQQIAGLLAATNQQRDGKVELEADDWAYGFNLGLMFQPTSTARIGFSFRSKVKLDAKGDATFTIPDLSAPPLNAAVNAGVKGNVSFRNSGIKATVELPEIASLNAHLQLNDRWALMGDVTWTNWSRFKELRIKFDSGRDDAVTPEQWDDSYKFSLGASFKLNDKWTLRGGLAYDKSPVDDVFRTPRIPDGDRIWLAFGARYNIAANNSIDVGFAHIFVDDPSLNKTSDETNPGTTTPSALRTRLVGKYDSDVNILSVQYNHRF
jgi:long-chain fatty acid transport protein